MQDLKNLLKFRCYLETMQNPNLCKKVLIHTYIHTYIHTFYFNSNLQRISNNELIFGMTFSINIADVILLACTVVSRTYRCSYFACFFRINQISSIPLKICLHLHHASKYHKRNESQNNQSQFPTRNKSDCKASCSGDQSRCNSSHTRSCCLKIKCRELYNAWHIIISRQRASRKDAKVLSDDKVLSTVPTYPLNS